MGARDDYLNAIGRYGAAIDTLNSLKYSKEHISGHANALGEKNTDLINEKNDKLRDAHMSTYNQKKYKAQTDVVTIFIVICVCIILVLSIRNIGYIGTDTANIAIFITLVVGGIVLVGYILDIAMRDNMDYDAYSWQYSAENDEPSVYEYNRRGFNNLFNGGTDLSKKSSQECVGQACCGDYFILQNGKCVPESFTTIQDSIGERIVPTNKHTIDQIQLPLPKTNVTPLSVHTDCGTCTNY